MTVLTLVCSDQRHTGQAAGLKSRHYFFHGTLGEIEHRVGSVKEKVGKCLDGQFVVSWERCLVVGALIKGEGV